MERKDRTPGENEIRVLNDPEVLRLIADPLRLRLLELLRQAPHTVTELAELLGVARTRLYYHIRLLESHDLVAVAETQVVAGITEKRYRVTAYRLTVDRSLIGGTGDGGDPLDVLLSVILEEVAGEIRRAVSSGLIDLSGGTDRIAPRGMALGRTWFRLTDKDVEDLSRRYEAMWDGFQGDEIALPGSARPGSALPGQALPNGATDGRTLYEWLIGFYPIVPPDTGEGESQ